MTSLPTVTLPVARIIPTYSRYAKCIEVIDGDTIVIQKDMGNRLFIEESVRLFGIDCPDKDITAKEKAKQFSIDWISRITKSAKTIETFRGIVDESEWPLIVQTYKPDKDIWEKYGRYLAVVFPIWKAPSLNADLVSSGNARLWDGRGSHPW